MHAIYVILVLAVSVLGLIAFDTRRHRAEVLDAAHAQRSAVCVRRTGIASALYHGKSIDDGARIISTVAPLVTVRTGQDTARDFPRSRVIPSCSPIIRRRRFTSS
jgi:hypothetical protein